MELNNVQVELSAYIGKLLRDKFGKGPEAVYVSIGYTFISIYVRNFITPMERVLMDQKQEITVQQTRDMLMRTLIPEMRAYIKIVTGIELQEFYYDWGLHNKSGIFVGISSDPFTEKESLEEEYKGKELIHQEINHISNQVQKVPEELYSCQLNSRTLLLIRNGILVNIEKELIRMGFNETLKIAKRNLEKTYLHNNNHFESILQTKVVDSFVDWDFDLDKSIIIFIMNPT